MSSTYDNTVFDFDLDFLNQPPPINAEPEPEPDLQAKCDRLRKSVIYFKKRVKVIDHYVTVAKAAKNEIAELRISEKKLKNQCKQHHVEIGNFIEKVTRLENDLQASVDRERQKNETISELENKIVATQKIYAQYKVLVEEHRLEPSRNKKGKAGVVNNAQKTLIEKEVETLRKNNAKLLNLDKVNEKLRKENARIPNLEKEIENLRKNNISEKVNDHTENVRIEQLEKEIEILCKENAKISKLENEIAVLHKQNAEIPKLERELVNLQKENTKISKLEKEIEYLQKENAKIPKLMKEIENLHKENVKLTKLGSEKETLSKLNIKISNLEKDYDILRIKNIEIETENKAFRKKIDSITSKCEDQLTNLTATTKENGKLRTKHNKLTRKYKSLPDRQSDRSDDSEAENDVFENLMLSPIPNDTIGKKSLIAGKDTAVPCEFDTEHSPEYLVYSPSNGENIENDGKPEDTAMSGSPILLKETETPTIIIVDHNENQSVCELKSVSHKKSHSTNDEREASNSVDTSNNVRPKKRTEEKECLEVNKSVSHRKSHSNNDERELFNSVYTSENVRPKKRTQEKECLEINKSVSHRKSHSKNDKRELFNSVDTSKNVRPKKRTQEKECLEINKSVSHRKSHSNNDERELFNCVDTSDNVRPKKRTQEKECLEITKGVSHRKSHSNNDERELFNCVDTSDNVRPKKRTQEKECLEITKGVSHRKSHSNNDERELFNNVDTSENVRSKKLSQEKEYLEINNSLRFENHTELELENIFSTMKLNYNAISPIPKTPINVDSTSSPSEKFDRCSSLCYKTIDFMQTLIKMAVSQGRDRYKVNISDCDKMIACFESILKSKQFLTETNPEHSVLNTNSNMKLSDCVLGPDDNNLGTISNPESSTTSSQKETDIPQHKKCEKRLSQNALLLQEENQNQLLCNVEKSITMSNPSSPDKGTNMYRDKQVEKRLLQCLPMSMDENQLINHSVSEELATDNEMSKATDSDGSSHDIIEVNQPPIIKKKRKNKKKTNLSKIRKNIKPKYKIRIQMSQPENKRVKPKQNVPQNVPIKRKVTENDTSASLNSKDIYEKAVKFMAQLNSQQSAKQAKTPEHTNDIHKPPRHTAFVEKDIESSNDNQVLHNCSISTRSKRKISELSEPCTVLLIKDPLLISPRKSENATTHQAKEDNNSSNSNSTIHRAKEDNNINKSTTVTHKVIEDIESSNEIPLRKRLRRSSDKSLNLFSMNAKERDKNSTTDRANEDKNSTPHRAKQDNISTTDNVKEDTVPSDDLPLRKRLKHSSDKPLNISSSNAKENSNHTIDIATKDKNSATNRAKEDIISTPQKPKEDIELPNELPLRKRLRRSSNEPHIQYKRVLRSATVQTKLCTEVYNELSKSKIKSNRKSIKGAGRNDSATQINDESTLHNSNVASYVDLDLFSEDIQLEKKMSETLRHSSDKPLNIISMNTKEDNNSTNDRAKGGIKPSNELPLQKERRRSSNEPRIQYKRVLRSSTVNTKLCTEDNIELPKSKGKIVKKSILVASENESATQINNESTLNNSNVVNYEDLDLFSEDIQFEKKMSEMLKSSSDKPLNFNSMNTEEDIKPYDELPLEKGLRRSSNEPVKQYKAVFRSATLHTKLCTEDNIELSKSKGKSSTKSKMVPSDNKSATHIINESTLNNSNGVSYEDLDIFSEDIQFEKKKSVMLRRSSDKPLNFNSMNTEEDIKPSDELPLEKGLRRFSNEPLKQYKAVFRSATVHTKLCTEDNIELSKSKGSTKSIMVPSENESATQINNESTLLHNSNVVSYEDLDVFSENIQIENKMRSPVIEVDADKSDYDPKDSILCHMIKKYGMETATRIEKRIPGKVVTNICEKIERDITIIIQNHCNKKAKDNLVADLRILNYKHFIAGLMQFLAKPERKLELFGKLSGYPAPAMTKTEQILLDVIAQLKKHWPSVDIVDAVLCSIEFTLFKLNRTPDFDVIESVSHFYAVLCRFVKAQSRLRLFILDAMYCIQFKSVPLIKQCLEVWMSLIPLAHMGIAKSPMVTCLVYLLHFYKCDDRYNRVQELRKILRDQYFYKITNWSETKILEMFKNSITGLRDISIEKKMLRLALIILAKRRGPRWCQLHIVKNLLEPMIQKKNVPNNVKHFCVSLIGPLMKPYPADMKIHCEIAINQLLDILDNNPTPELEEAAITSMMVINRHDQHSLNKMLLSRKMKPMSLTLEKTIRDYVKARPLKVWEMHLSTMGLELETYYYYD